MANSDPRESRDAHYQNLRNHEDETRRLADEQRAAIDTLKEQRKELRLAAAHSAGQLGLQYQSDSNTFIRFVSGLEEELVLPEIVERPQPLAPETTIDAKPEPIEQPKLVATPKERKQAWLEAIGDGLMWVLMLPVGGFVGIGLATLAGFQWQREPAIQWMAIAFGFAVVAGLKVLFSHLWGMLGREKALGNPRTVLMITAILVTIGGCALDAHLGASALMQYSRMRSFRVEDAMQYGAAFWLALAVTSPLLLASAARSWKKGLKEPTIEERENAQIERERAEIDRKNSLVVANHEKKILESEAERVKHRDAKQALIESSHADQLELSRQKFEALKELETKRDQDWSELKSYAEFKCLQGLISQIDVVSAEIRERERDLVNFKISRGYEKSAKAGAKNQTTYYGGGETEPLELSLLEAGDETQPMDDRKEVGDQNAFVS